MSVCIDDARLRLVATSLVVCASLALPTAATAQVAIGAALGLSTQPAGASGSPYLGPGFGGTSLGAVISLDVDVSPRVSLGGELTKARDISGSQQERVSGGSNTFLSEHHDTLVYGIVKLKPRTWAAYHLAAVAGLGFARRQTQRTGGTFNSSRPPFAMTPIKDETLSDAVLAVTGGMDGVFPISRRAGILALVRVHYLADKDLTREFIVYRGVSSLIFRYGIGARVRF
jgi:hypothetical protein